MSNISDLRRKTLPAEFDGIQFFVTQESESTGQKVAIHEYPNSDKRFAEPLGGIPSTFKINCLLFGGGDLTTRRLELLTALRTPGVKTLVHPYYGRLEVQAGAVTASTANTAIGVVEIEVEFYRSETEVTPRSTDRLGQRTKGKSTYAQDKAADKIPERYEPPRNGREQDDAEGAAGEVLDNQDEKAGEAGKKEQSKQEEALEEAGLDQALQLEIAGRIAEIKQGLAKFRSSISAFKTNISRIMQDASRFKEALLNTYNDIASLADYPELLADFWDGLMDFDFSGDRPQPPPTTPSRARQASNRRLIRDVNRLLGLAGSYGAKSLIDFESTDALNESIARTDRAFDLFFSGDNIFSSDRETRDRILDLRSSSKKALEAQAARTFNVVEIDVKTPSSMALVVYRYYGGLNNLAKIAELNRDKNPALLVGKIKILSR